ncbi:OmpW/AlkL family protein [Sapientia aquatica]|uniref:OmpW family protein n=1 Tax=Sapientia aquatica TaxID=1549640 RepID=A0A4R5W162_9BURK|nr:OmpW family outer membrane protein [Sapientia aquatica]TDK65644.1 OmpW family protein [Sapientia aquatica]
MKMQTMKQRANRVGAALVLSSASWVAQAQSAGDNVLSLGWIHIMPQNRSSPSILESVAGKPQNMVLAGTGSAVQNGDTGGINLAHFFTDNFSIESVGGIPSPLKTKGEGKLAPFGVIGQATPMAPTLFARYHFWDSKVSLRPYLGMGINYTRFVHSKLTNNAFVESVGGPGSSGTLSVSSSWNPAFLAGLNYALDSHWSLGLSLSYIPLKETATTTVTTANKVVIVTTGDDKIRPISTYLNLAYCF